MKQKKGYLNLKLGLLKYSGQAETTTNKTNKTTATKQKQNVKTKQKKWKRVLKNLEHQ